jgi:hypothetical protein
LYLQIEDRVSFNRLADATRAAAVGQPAELPLSHVAWVLFCCLKHGGAPIMTAGDVHTALVTDSGELGDYGRVIGELMLAYYGVNPEHVEKRVKKKRKTQ